MEISPNTLEPLAQNNLNPAGIISVPQQKIAVEQMGKKIKIRVRSSHRTITNGWFWSLSAALSPCPADLLDPPSTDGQNLWGLRNCNAQTRAVQCSHCPNLTPKPGHRAECRNRGLCKSPPELVPLSGHKPFPGSSCSQMSMGRTGNENIVLRWFLCHNPQLIPSPRLPVLSDQHRNFPLSPCGYNTCIFHSEFKISSSAAKLGNLSQWSLPSCCFQQHFCPSASPLGMGFPPWPARVTGNQENPSTAWAKIALGAVLGWLLAAGWVSASSICRKQTPRRKGNPFRSENCEQHFSSTPWFPKLSSKPRGRSDSSLALLKSCDVAKSVTKQNMS